MDPGEVPGRVGPSSIDVGGLKPFIPESIATGCLLFGFGVSSFSSRKNAVALVGVSSALRSSTPC